MIPALFLPCAQGVEPLLVDELQRLPGLGAARIEPWRGGAVVHANSVDEVPVLAMHCNLESRLAQRVLWPLAFGEYRNEHDLYDLARSVDWLQWITPRETLKVDITATRSPLQSLNFALLRIKDAVCDVLRDATGERPSVDTHRPHLPLLLHLTAQDATLYVDTSGEALFKRGWRDDKGEAPLKETLAAAMLAAAGWQGRAQDGPLLDPCCGAGTIAIEAAQLACGIAPGSQRRFAFERLAPFRAALPQWQQIKQAAQARVHAPAVAVYAGDVSFRMTDFATRNAERAGVLEAIEFKTADALQRPAPGAAGTLMLNPPYGERIDPKGRGSAGHAARQGFEDGAGPAEFFAQLASHWKKQYSGWTAWVLSPDAKLPSWMRLKESRRVPLWNGPIECRLFRFDLVAGSLRRPASAPASGDGGAA
ncbi:THUMP domain-containing class I SAM-dependent RNA methyltransferase [Ideonella sp. BN130291]|uniref:THUMP domain-containing class I SAM-dependent RNA methyltransferase n=1 Tax=Ideonella sp. BN130291 TaxID=3112940 RepID=UPI002E25AFE9|nr:THUMP domain-containing protein [Ideonella sp. BN130291]